MAEAAAAGVLPHLFWDYTYRELYAAIIGRNKRDTRWMQRLAWAGWHSVNWSRARKLPPLVPFLRKLEPRKVMSARELRASIVGIAQVLGARVVHRKKEL